MKTILVGAGYIAQQHAKALSSLGVRIIGVLDPNRESAGNLASQYNAKALDNLNEMIEQTDMVHLLCPPADRIGYLHIAAEAGKHIFCEKPLSVTIEDATAMIACAKQNNVKLAVGFNQRFRDGFLHLQDAVQSGALGDISGAYFLRQGIGAGFAGAYQPGWRLQEGHVCGISIESVSHDIDMLLHLLPGVESVSANVYGSIEGISQFDNNSAVSFTIKGGGVGAIFASWSAYLDHGVRGLSGSKGSAMLTGAGQWDYDEFKLKTADMAFAQSTLLNDRFVNTALESYTRINRHFIECIQHDKQPITSGEDGLRALIFSRAILESSRTGASVRVDL